jgi:hypothetical protein
VVADWTNIGAWSAIIVATLPGLFALAAGHGERKAARAKALLDARDKDEDRDSKDKNDMRQFAQAQMSELVTSLRRERDDMITRLRDQEKSGDARAGLLQTRCRALEDDFERMRARARYWHDQAHRCRQEGSNVISALVITMSAHNIRRPDCPPIDFQGPKEIPELPPFDDQTPFAYEKERTPTI